MRGEDGNGTWLFEEGMVKSARAQGLRDKVSAVQPQFLIFSSCDKWSTLQEFNKHAPCPSSRESCF